MGWLDSGGWAGDASGYASLAQVQALAAKPTAACAAQGNVNTASPPAASDAVWDGATPVSGEVVLLPRQTTASQNGGYVYQGIGVAMARASWCNEDAEVTGGIEVRVRRGTLDAEVLYVVTSDGSGTAGRHVVGTDAITFTRETSLQSNVEIIKKAFTFSTTSPLTVAALSASDDVDEIELVMDIAFNGTGGSLQVGTTATPGLFLSTSELDPYTVATVAAEGNQAPGATNLTLSIVPGTASQGSGYVLAKLRRA